MKNKTIAVASDHAGFELKEYIKPFLEDWGYTVVDHGSFSFNANDDYPSFMASLARDVSKHSDSLRGIVFGGSGQGEAIVCNRFPGVRAAVYYGGNVDIVHLSREHNDANVLSLGARFLSLDEAKIVIKTWLETEFPGEEKHVRRITQINQINIL